MQKIQIDLKNIDPANLDLIYNALDSIRTLLLKKRFESGLVPSWAQPAKRYNHLLLGPIMTMMRRGLKVDVEMRSRLIDELTTRIAQLRTTFNTVCLRVFGTDINSDSPAQLKFLFYELLAIPEQWKSKKGEMKLSTDRDTLEKIAKSYARAVFFVNIILRIKDLEKQLDVFTKKLSPTGRFHTSFNIGGTETFRLSSSEHPLRIGSNAQNISGELRPAFIPDEGYVMFQADQQGAEARLVAYLSGDANYIKAVESGDVHTMVASMVFGFEPKRELAERKYYREYTYRDLTKKGSHGSNYYGKPYTLAQQMKVETSVAEEFQIAYFRKFPGISEWHVSVAEQLQRHGYIVGPFGIRRDFWNRTWDDATLREAIAFVPQHCVGVLMNIGIHRLWERFEQDGDMQILLNGHDAVIGQMRVDKAPTLILQILERLTFPFDVTDIRGKVRRVTIPFDIEVGYNWGKYDAVKNPKGLKKWKN